MGAERPTVVQSGGVGMFERSDDHAGVSAESARAAWRFRVSSSVTFLRVPALWTSGARQSGATKCGARPERSCAEALSAVGA
jgi:hypothetical protein